jgi:hypothetical protein
MWDETLSPFDCNIISRYIGALLILPLQIKIMLGFWVRIYLDLFQ